MRCAPVRVRPSSHCLGRALQHRAHESPRSHGMRPCTGRVSVHLGSLLLCVSQGFVTQNATYSAFLFKSRLAQHACIVCCVIVRTGGVVRCVCLCKSTCGRNVFVQRKDARTRSRDVQTQRFEGAVQESIPRGQTVLEDWFTLNASQAASAHKSTDATSSFEHAPQTQATLSMFSSLSVRSSAFVSCVCNPQRDVSLTTQSRYLQSKSRARPKF